MGGYGIVGGHIPLGVGMAYALRYQGTDSIVQLYLGDGAIHNGAFHEAANLAGLWGRDGLNPCLFILENNQYGMGTSVERATAMTDLAAKFDSYGIEHEKVDGMDLLAVLECARRIATQVRETGQPYAVEALTYRLVPHGAGRLPRAVPHQGRGRRVAQARPDRDRRRRASSRPAWPTKSNSKPSATRCARRVDEAVQFADESPEPDLERAVYRRLRRLVMRRETRDVS